MKEAYLAGMIDADGHICWREEKGNRQSNMYLGVTSNSLPLIQWLKSSIGGSYFTQRKTCFRPCPEKSIPGHFCRLSDIYRWHCTGHRAVIVTKAIHPYLIIKKEKAEQCWAMYEENLHTMQRPARRLFHIRKEEKAMHEKGWISDKDFDQYTLKEMGGWS